MDWLRRNWPDLLIGVALVAVIAGIIATLISGGSFFPGNRGAQTPRTPASGVESVNGPDADEPAADAVEPASPAGAAQGGAASDAQDAVADELAAVQSAVGDAVEALPPDGQSAAQAAGSSSLSSSLSSSVSPPAVAVEPPQSSSSLSSSVGRAPSEPIETPAASDLPDAPYRVSVGAFANVENAQRQLDAFAAAGYPAFIGTQGNLNIVLVGPYDDEDEARAAAAAISRSDLGVSDPTVYRFEPEDASEPAAATPPAQQPAAQPEPQPAAPQQVAEAPASGSRYLQVGAYASRESSLPLRERLEGMGFVVSDRVESGLVKLLVGPYADQDLEAARGRLTAAGIESFPR